MTYIAPDRNPGKQKRSDVLGIKMLLHIEVRSTYRRLMGGCRSKDESVEEKKTEISEYQKTAEIKRG